MDKPAPLTLPSQMMQRPSAPPPQQAAVRESSRSAVRENRRQAPGLGSTRGFVAGNPRTA
jgi:hypothetical protein